MFPPNKVNIETHLAATDNNWRELLRFDLPEMLSVGIQFILVAVALSSLVFFLYGSLQWILAGGEKDGIEKARKKITNAIIGLVIALTLFAVTHLVRVVFGIDLAGDIDIPRLSP